MISDSFVSVVAPLFNDADIVEDFVSDICEVLKTTYTHYELILVDDGSKDDTAARVGALLNSFDHIRLIQLSRSFGQEIAIAAGLDSVIGDFVVVMLPESDPPALVPQMVEQSRQGAGVVFGVRRSRSSEPWLLSAGVNLFYWYCNRVLELNIPKNTTHFRVLNRQAVHAVTQIKDRMRYLHTLSAFVGYSKQSFYYDPEPRRKKPRRKSLFEAVNLAINIVVSNSIHPLRFISWLGVAVSIVNVLYMGYIIAIYLFKEQVAEGWVTQSMQSSVMFFFLFVILAILGEYMGRLLSETSGRPLYYVRDEKNSSVLLVDEGQKNVVADSVGGWRL
jgi:dolichol-phosphate mannosyltransferase